MQVVTGLFFKKYELLGEVGKLSQSLPFYYLAKPAGGIIHNVEILHVGHES
jgi:hypothetical protein